MLKFKLDVFDVFKHFKANVENQLDTKIKFLRTDRGGEFTSNAFKHFFLSHGLIHHFTCPHTPQQTHLVGRTLTMLSHSQLPTPYWSYAISTTVHIVNRLPTPNLQNLTPWELLFHSIPNIACLRTFGCTCFPLLKPYNTHKLQPHNTPCIFLGYPTYIKGYIFLDLVTSRIYIYKHVLFNETEFLSPQSLSTGSTLAQPGPTQFSSPIILQLDPLSTLSSTLPSPIPSPLSDPFPTSSPILPCPMSSPPSNQLSDTSPSLSLPVPNPAVPTPSLPDLLATIPHVPVVV